MAVTRGRDLGTKDFRDAAVRAAKHGTQCGTGVGGAVRETEVEPDDAEVEHSGSSHQIRLQAPTRSVHGFACCPSWSSPFPVNASLVRIPRATLGAVLAITKWLIARTRSIIANYAKSVLALLLEGICPRQQFSSVDLEGRRSAATTCRHQASHGPLSRRHPAGAQRRHCSNPCCHSGQAKGRPFVSFSDSHRL